MVPRNASHAPSGKHLLRRLSDDKALPAFVPTLPARGLKTLVDRVGVEDAGMLIEYSSTTQLTALLDEYLWIQREEGAPETFDREEFLRWAQVLLDVGDGFAAERLRALDEDLMVLALTHLLDVTDLDKHLVEKAKHVSQAWQMPDSVEMTELYGPFEVRPRVEEDWEVLQLLLAALHVEDDEFLQAILTRCCLPESMLPTRDHAVAALDAAGDRQDRRERQGFVTAESADGFLRAAREADVETLAAQDAYDLSARAWFDLGRRAVAERVLKPDAVTPRALTDGRAGADELGADDFDEDGAEQLAAEDFAALEALVAEVELEAVAEPVRRLAGPSARTGQASALQRALARCAEEDPAHATRHMQEAAYLSNILMASTRLLGEPLGERPAVELVMATCGLGIEVRPDHPLDREPGLIGLFRIGWHTLQRVPGQVLAQLQQTLQAADLQAVFGLRAWIMEDALRALAAGETAEQLAARDFGALQETLRMLSLGIEDQAVERLVRLVDALPTLRGEPDRSGRPRVAFIDSRARLVEVASFVLSIEEHAKR